MISISSTISNKCLLKLITHIKGYIPINAVNDKSQVIKYTNEFLTSIDYILSGKHEYNEKNWIERGRRLYAFSLIYIDLITFSECKTDTTLHKSFKKYMCTKNLNNLIPMRQLYKTLANLSLLYLQECLYFYLYDDTNKGNKINVLKINSVLENMYNANLRYSKTDTMTCIDKLQYKNDDTIQNINKYLITALELRRHYLEFCKEYIHIKPNSKIKHNYFEENLQGLINAVSNLLEKSIQYQ
jgi:hypothetical protein